MLLIVLTIAAAVAVNSKSVHDYVLKQATEMLAEKLQTRVSIDSAAISLLKGSVKFYGMEIDDQQQRRMLRIDRLETRIRPSALLRKEIIIMKADVAGLDALLQKASKEEPANYQFIIDAFKKDSTQQEKLETKGGQKLALKFRARKINLDNIHIKYDGNNLPRKNTGKPHRGFFDAKHFDLTTSLQLTIDSVGKDGMTAQLTQCTIRDSITGIDIRDLRTDIRIAQGKLYLKNITIQQKSTILNIDEGEITLPSKKEGRTLSYQTGTITGKVLLKDISRAFAPVLSKFNLPLNLSVSMSGTDSTMAFRDILVTTVDKRLHINADGNIRNLKDKYKLDIRFNVHKMTAKSGIKERIINQFPVKKMMMKQLHALGNITYRGQLAVLRKRETFQGRLLTAGGSLYFHLNINDSTKYVSGNVKSKSFHLGKIMNIKGLGDMSAEASFKVDISKKRTARMRRQKGGKLPIGSVDALIEETRFKGIHIKNLSATITSDGAEANGDLVQQGKWRDLYCSFTFTDTDQMHKMKIRHPGIRFHKKSDPKARKLSSR